MQILALNKNQLKADYFAHLAHYFIHSSDLFHVFPYSTSPLNQGVNTSKIINLDNDDVMAATAVFSDNCDQFVGNTRQ